MAGCAAGREGHGHGGPRCCLSEVLAMPSASTQAERLWSGGAVGHRLGAATCSALSPRHDPDIVRARSKARGTRGRLDEGEPGLEMQGIPGWTSRSRSTRESRGRAERSRCAGRKTKRRMSSKPHAGRIVGLCRPTLAGSSLVEAAKHPSRPALAKQAKALTK